jgi:hypothetical protein
MALKKKKMDFRQPDAVFAQRGLISMKIEIVTVDEKSKIIFGKAIQELESYANYPFGDDFFKIDHGINYFYFFERLGEVSFRVALSQGKVVACAAGVLRTLKINEKLIKTWYLCDLKVHPDFFGRRIPSKMFRANLVGSYLKCGRAYAISMIPANGENRVVRLLKKFSYLPFKQSTIINFYNLQYPQLLQFIEKNKLGPQSFLSLSAKKDLIMKSTGKAMKLLHYQHGEFADSHCVGPLPDHFHMYCSAVGSNLDNLLSKDFKPDASASVISHRMANFDWDFILSSDI